MNDKKNNDVREIIINNSETLDLKIKQLNKKKVFDNKALFPLLLRFILPTILVSFFQATYVFVDQIMMIKFIPFSDNLNPNGLNIENLVGNDIYQNYLNALNDKSTALTMSDLIRASISISAPITVILNATSLLISMGIGISFSKAIGKKNIYEINQVWSTGFISNLLVGTIISLIILGFTPIWLRSSAIGDGNINSNLDLHDDIQIFAHKFQNVQVQLAQNYIYLLCGLNIFQIMTQMYYLLSQSEGRQVFISIVPTLCNLLNVMFDYIFIVFIGMALIGSALATVIGWIINFIAYFIYSLILTSKNKTYLNIKNLRFKLFKWNFFAIIIFIGLASFFRNASTSFSNAMFQTYLVTVTQSTHYFPLVTNSPNFFQSIYGSVTPISNLVLQSVWGVIQGGRTICSYKYGCADYKSIKKIYWYVIGISTIYGLFMYFLFAFGLNNILLFNLFNVESKHLFYTTKVLRITLLQSIFVAIGTTAQVYFQSTQKIIFSWISSLIQNVFLFIPMLFIFQAGANSIANESATNAMNFFIWLPSVCAILATIINVLLSLIHLYKRLGKYEDEIKNNLRKPSKLIAR